MAANFILRQSPAWSIKPGVTAADLSIYYLEPGEGGTRFHKIEVSEDGDFMTDWPGASLWKEKWSYWVDLSIVCNRSKRFSRS